MPDMAHTSASHPIINCCRRISREEIRGAVSKLKHKRAAGPDEIPIEVWKCMGVQGLEWLTNLFNVILRTSKMPWDWRLSKLIPVYKKKGDVQLCNNYRGIKLLSYTMKL